LKQGSPAIATRLFLLAIRGIEEVHDRLEKQGFFGIFPNPV
jgi:uncharacterized protein YcgL (UPF0745 family)